MFLCNYKGYEGHTATFRDWMEADNFLVVFYQIFSCIFNFIMAIVKILLHKQNMTSASLMRGKMPFNVFQRSIWSPDHSNK